MPNSWNYILSYLGRGNVVNLADGNTADGAGLILYPVPASGPTPDELWQIVPDPGGSGYYFIMSQVNGKVIDVNPETQQIICSSQRPPGESDSQLWTFTSDPGGSGFSAIENMTSTAGNALVINVDGGSTDPGTNLILYPAPEAGPTPDELWLLATPSPTTPERMEWSITALEWDRVAQAPDGPQNGLGFIAAQGSLFFQYELPGNNGQYYVTTSPGAQLQLDTMWTYDGFFLVNSAGGVVNPNITSSPATIIVAWANPV